MKLESITPLLLTYNEAPNLARTLARLRWAAEVLVLDSGSNDGTLSICEQFTNVRVENREFDTHARQWNHGLSLVSTPWVLALDADFVVSEDLPFELENLSPDRTVNGFRSRFRYCVNGAPLRGSLYPPRTVLFRRENCSFVQDGHTQLLTGDEPAGMLRSMIDHDDRKPLSRWLKSQAAYAALEAGKLSGEVNGDLGFPDRLRKAIWPAAPLTLLYTLFVKGTLFDGWNGIYYALQRTYAELLLSLELLSRKLSRGELPSSQHD